jgi:type VI secretion system protein ImpI
VYLTFEVTSANATSLGAARRKVFTVDGGRIGRSPDNDMVLPGVGVHRHHATVRFINGVFFVEGVGTNGIAINNPEVVLPRNEPYPLKTGDKVFIDEYEVAVTTSATAPADPAAPRAVDRSGTAPRMNADSTGPGSAGQGSGRAPLPPLTGALDDDAAEDLDPLRNLLGGAAPQPPRPRAPVPDPAWNHSSSLADHFTPPPVAPAPPPAAGSRNVIPENWDRTTFDRSKLQPPPPSHAPQQPAQHQSRTQSPPSQHQPQYPQAPVPGRDAGAAAQRPLPAAVGTGRPGGAVSAGNAQAAGAAAARVGASSSPGATSSTGPTPSAGAAFFDWDAFLRAANVEPSRVPPETAAIMGNIMRSVVQGLIEVLRARSEIKTEFRMPVTQVKVSENNPLKFAANAEDALGNLLGRRNPAYLPPQEAFEDAFNDVRFHQLAMLAGVRAGFDNLLDRFDPAHLQESFDRTGKRGLFGGGKASYWERYAERFQEMTADRDETFRRLFGEEFARAYEQQLSALKRGRKGTP